MALERQKCLYRKVVHDAVYESSIHRWRRLRKQKKRRLRQLHRWLRSWPHRRLRCSPSRRVPQPAEELAALSLRVGPYVADMQLC